MKNCEVLEINRHTAQEIQNAAMDAASKIGALLESDQSCANAAAAASEIALSFPLEITEELDNFRRSGNNQGAIALRGLYPPTELHTSRPDKMGNLPDSQHANAAGLLALAATTLVGQPISYTTNPRGHRPTLVTQVTPMKDNPYTWFRNVAIRTANDSGWHSEAAAAPPDRRVDFLALYGINGQADVPTWIMPAGVIEHSFSQSDRLRLRRHDYLLSETIVPGSEHIRRPILSDTRRGVAVSYGEFYKTATEAMEDPLTLAALQKVADNLDRLHNQATTHTLESGDVLFIDNNGLHRRPAFTPQPPNLRWQMRVFAGSPHSQLFVDPTDR